VTEAATKNAVITFTHPGKKLRDFSRLMTESGIDLEHPVGTSSECFAISPYIRINDVLVLRRPNYPEFRTLLRQLLHELQGVVLAHLVEYHKELDGFETT